VFVFHVLGDVGDGAAILAAQAQALKHPQAEQDERGGHTNILVGRDQPDTPRAKPHAAERKEERVFAAHLVAHPSEQECPQGTDQESGSEQRNRAQQRRNRAGLVEELDRQDRGQAPENVEIIPLDDVAHRRRDDHGSEVLGNCCPSHCRFPSRLLQRLLPAALHTSQTREPGPCLTLCGNSRTCLLLFGLRPKDGGVAYNHLI
jgi:hypothetical protein